jgi:hypothetical protein
MRTYANFSRLPKELPDDVEFLWFSTAYQQHYLMVFFGLI